MCIVFVCMRYVKKFGCHYNQSGVLKIEILILLRLARFQNLGTPPNIAFKISVFLAQKIKITKLGKLRLTKSNNMRTIWTTSFEDLSLNCVIV